jgi:hypothetical protein
MDTTIWTYLLNMILNFFYKGHHKLANWSG